MLGLCFKFKKIGTLLTMLVLQWWAISCKSNKGHYSFNQK